MLSVGDKLEQANSNIKQLVAKIVRYTMDESQSYCIKDVKDCSGTPCVECKRKYFNKLSKEMLSRYIVN